MIRSAFVAAAILTVALMPYPGLVSAPAHAAPKNAVCMGSLAKGAALGKRFTIVVPRGSVSEMEARGFIAEPCEGKENSVPQYRKAMCDLAVSAPPAVKDSLEAVYGIGPDELCQLAGEL